jgi:hypothetical protein
MENVVFTALFALRWVNQAYLARAILCCVNNLNRYFRVLRAIVEWEPP